MEIDVTEKKPKGVGILNFLDCVGPLNPKTVWGAIGYKAFKQARFTTVL
jgi:hypothetical protein